MKLYEFRITLQKAMRDAVDGSYAIVFGGSDTVYANEYVTMTLPDAIKRRDELSAAESRTHAAFVGMRHSRDRKPAGFGKLDGPIYK